MVFDADLNIVSVCFLQRLLVGPVAVVVEAVAAVEEAVADEFVVAGAVAACEEMVLCLFFAD